MKLVLFDIDGTLIYHVGPRKWEEQYMHGLRVAYGIEDGSDFAKYNGNIEVQAAWDIVRKHGISRGEFFEKFPAYIAAMHDHLEEWAGKGSVFRGIADAQTLVSKLSAKPSVILGVLTGNAKKLADWKLRHAGIVGNFRFGLYGEAADDRIALAKTVFEEARVQLHRTIAPEDVVVIGDTVHDIRCGKAIGAVTIAVTTGMHNLWDILEAEQPDFLVNSLTDPRILNYFGLSYHDPV